MQMIEELYVIYGNRIGKRVSLVTQRRLAINFSLDLSLGGTPVISGNHLSLCLDEKHDLFLTYTVYMDCVYMVWFT